MTDQYVPKLRQRFLEDMRIKGLQPKTQTMYLRAMRDFTRFLGHAPDSATPEELRAFQLDMKERGVGAPTFNNRLTVLSFFFVSTCPRPEMKRHMRYQRGLQRGLWWWAPGQRGHSSQGRRYRQRSDADPRRARQRPQGPSGHVVSKPARSVARLLP